MQNRRSGEGVCGQWRHCLKTALVTGANKGIGREVVRQLADRGYRVFLGARNLDAGEKAVREINAENVLFIALDISEPTSIAEAVLKISGETRSLDVLVNNAAIIAEGDDDITTVSAETVRETLTTNTIGPLLVTQAFLPLLKKSKCPRVINVSSGGGQLDDGMDTWAPAYCLSKTALNAVTSLFAASQTGIAVNSVCPGWVRTDMGGAGATRSVEEGAETIVWLADEAPHDLSGKFYRDKEVIPW